MRAGLRLYLGVAVLARLAEEGMAVAVVLLAAARTGSPAEGAFTLTAWMAPHVATAPLAGGLAARVRRPKVLYAPALAGYAAAVAAVALLLGRAPVAVTAAVALAGGACGPVVSGGLSSLVAELVPDGPARARGYALDAASYSAASVAGPAVTSVLAATAGPGAATLALAGAAAAAACLVTALPLSRAAPPAGARSRGAGAAGAGPSNEAPGGPGASRPQGSGGEGRGGLRGDLLAGLVAVGRVRELRAITIATCTAFLGVGGLTTTAALRGAELGRPGGGGALMTAFAAGALAGALAVARRGATVPAPVMALVSLLGTAVTLAAAALAPTFALCAAAFAAAGLLDGPLLTATLRLRADHAPPGTRTQVFTAGAGLKITAAAAGAALTGAVTAGGAPPAAGLLFAIAALHAAAGLAYPLLRRAPAVPPAAPPDTGSDSGPDTAGPPIFRKRSGHQP